MNEYPINPVSKIVGMLFASALIGGAFLMLNKALQLDDDPGRGPLFTMAVIFFLIGAWLFIGSIRLCVTVDDEAVRVRGARGTRELPLSEIDGYRCGSKSSFFLVRKNGKNFMIPGYISQRSELINWITTHYEDADKRERDAETQSILNDDRYGSTQEERKAAFTKARNLSWGTTFPSIVLGSVIIAVPSFAPLLFVLYALPWLGVYLTWRSNGLIRLSIRKGTPHPSLFYMMAFTSFTVGISAVTHFRFYGFSSHSWRIASLTAVAAILIALLGLRTTIALERRKALSVLILVLFAGFYGIGVATSSNCVLDNGTPQIMEATVYNKFIKHGRSTSYDLDLSSWGRYTNGNTISVSQEVFSRTKAGDIIRIAVYPGKWGIPWYKINVP